MSGYVKLHRGWHDNKTLSQKEAYCERAAWAWLVTNAAWKDTARRTSQGSVVVLARGEIHVSLGSLSAAWGWSIKRVRGFIGRLEKGHMTGTKKGTSGTILSILNYEKYQGNGEDKGTAGAQLGAQSGHTQEEGKEVKKEEEGEVGAQKRANGGDYAFEGKTVRLSPTDFEAWRARYRAIPDLTAELGALDDWLQGQDETKRKRWFHTVSGALNRKHQEMLIEAAPADDLGDMAANETGQASVSRMFTHPAEQAGPLPQRQSGWSGLALPLSQLRIFRSYQ